MPALLGGLATLPVSAQDPGSFAQELQQGLAQLRRWTKEAFQGDLNPVFPEKPEFAVLHSSLCEIFVAYRTFGKWWEGLNAIGQSLQGFRHCYQQDYPLVRAAVEDPGRVRGSRVIPRAAFGLPIVFYFPSLNRGAILRAEAHERRASPLLLRLVKLANDQYALVLVRFRAQFLPKGENLFLEVGKSRVPVAQPDDQILEDFLKRVEEELGGFHKIAAF